MPTQITEASIADLSDIVRLNGIVQDLHARLRPDIFRADWTPAGLEVAWRDRLTEMHNMVSIARLGCEAVGYIWFEVESRPQNALLRPRKRIYVHHVAIDDSARRSGIGARLLARAEREASRLGISTIVLDTWVPNTGAQAFFRAAGYQAFTVGLSKTIARS